MLLSIKCQAVGVFQFYLPGQSKQVIESLLELEFPEWLSGLRTHLVSEKMWVRSLALLRGLRISCCRELWCTKQTQLGSGVAVAMV